LVRVKVIVLVPVGVLELVLLAVNVGDSEGVNEIVGLAEKVGLIEKVGLTEKVGLSVGVGVLVRVTVFVGEGGGVVCTPKIKLSFNGVPKLHTLYGTEFDDPTSGFWLAARTKKLGAMSEKS
jgi:hypothetical protein